MKRHHKSEKHTHSPKSPEASRAPSPPPGPGPRSSPHAAYLDDARVDAHEHGERLPEPRQDELIGTSGSHSPPPDSRPEEPYGELAPSSETEGGDA